MDEVVKKDVLNVLSDVVKILKVGEETDVIELMELSNHTIHNASVFQDEDSVSIAILIYSLSKVIERKEGKSEHDQCSGHNGFSENRYGKAQNGCSAWGQEILRQTG